MAATPAFGASPPPPAAQSAALPESSAHPTDDKDEAASSTWMSAEVEYSKLPVELDRRLEALDVDAAMRPTKIKLAEAWHKKAQKGLLAPMTESVLRKDEQGSEKQKCFDLLDALSRAGSLPIDAASLHVILAATHCFDESLIDTLVVRNVNPIEKLERSSLIVAETIKGVAATELVRPEAYESLSKFAAPALLPPASLA